MYMLKYIYIFNICSSKNHIYMYFLKNDVLDFIMVYV